jgi:hypothetical protein
MNGATIAAARNKPRFNGFDIPFPSWSAATSERSGIMAARRVDFPHLPD